MSAESFQSYFDDPVYQSAMKHLQGGNWEAGLTELDKLISSYPLNHQLRTLRQEMKLRAQVDDDERIDITEANKRKRITWSIRLVVSAVLLSVIIWSAMRYSQWIGQQWVLTQQRLENEVQLIDQAVKFRDAQDLLQVGRLTEAKTKLEEVSAANPDYPGLTEALQRTDKMIALDSRYDEALRKINLGDLNGALEVLEGIEADEPFYKDVSTRIAEIKGQFFLGDIQSQAEKAYQSKNWEQAASSYETLRALNPSYQPEMVEGRLFESYMNAAMDTLSKDTESIQALELAETYFSKALSLRPQDPTIRFERDQARETFKDRLFSRYVEAAQAALSEKADSLEALATADEYFFKALELRPNDPGIQLQRRLAQLFVEAQDDFDKNRYDEVIEKLEGVITEEPEYASGTARQTLFEAYLARGDARMLGGDYEPAQTDFQRAVVLAEQGENTNLRLFQAQIRIAESMGAQLLYEDAVLLYRSAIDSANLSDADLKQRPELISKLKQADGYVQIRSYRSAFRIYRDQARKILFIFPKVSHVVRAGEYLTSLANQYNTTVEAILQANNLGSTKKVTTGQELVIPVLEP
ncbi:MAG TPA: LysM peptidoglycan-binding domain-containing protein [Anaerolineales bacterium]